MIYTLVIEGRLENLNEYIRACRANQYKGAGMKEKYEKIVRSAIKKQLKGLKITDPVIMNYRWYEKNRRRDLDNVSSFGRKVIQDALVKEKVLKNDGWNEIKGFSDSFYIDKENPRIEIDIVV